MLFLAILGMKISLSDLKSRKILNKDLSLIFIFSLLHHHIYQYRYALITILAGIIFSTWVGAGDSKLLALDILLKPNLTRTIHSLAVVVVALFLTALISFLRYRSLRVRAPIAPALCLGLIF